jgi:hypothetical protein
MPQIVALQGQRRAQKAHHRSHQHIMSLCSERFLASKVPLVRTTYLEVVEVHLDAGRLVSQIHDV